MRSSKRFLSLICFHIGVALVAVLTGCATASKNSLQSGLFINSYHSLEKDMSAMGYKKADNPLFNLKLGDIVEVSDDDAILARIGSLNSCDMLTTYLQPISRDLISHDSGSHDPGGITLYSSYSSTNDISGGLSFLTYANISIANSNVEYCTLSLYSVFEQRLDKEQLIDYLTSTITNSTVSTFVSNKLAKPKDKIICGIFYATGYNYECYDKESSSIKISGGTSKIGGSANKSKDVTNSKGVIFNDKFPIAYLLGSIHEANPADFIFSQEDVEDNQNYRDISSYKPLLANQCDIERNLFCIWYPAGNRLISLYRVRGKYNEARGGTNSVYFVCSTSTTRIYDISGNSISLVTSSIVTTNKNYVIREVSIEDTSKPFDLLYYEDDNDVDNVLFDQGHDKYDYLLIHEIYPNDTSIRISFYSPIEFDTTKMKAFKALSNLNSGKFLDDIKPSDDSTTAHELELLVKKLNPMIPNIYFNQYQMQTNATYDFTGKIHFEDVYGIRIQRP